MKRDFSEDKTAWEIEDQFMFGPDVLVAPIVYEGQRERKVYLPAGAMWRDENSDQVHEGGRWISVQAPLDQIPYFKRMKMELNKD